MRIAVHAKVLSEEHFTGIGVYTFNVLKALSEIDTTNEYTLYSNQRLLHPIQAPNFRVKLLKFPRFWSYLRLPWEFLDRHYDLLFVPKEFVPPFIRPKTVIVVYDLGFQPKQPGRVALSGRVHFAIATAYAIKAADRVIAISESTKREIVEICQVDPGKITAIPLGYDATLYKPALDPGVVQRVKEKYRISGPYLINTSSVFWERKNLISLIRAFHACQVKGASRHQLVITGKKGTAYQDILHLIRSLHLEDQVVLPGFAALEDMPILLSGADALVFPSLHEGFGLPLIEAMACGCPVISSNCSAMPEVVGDAGLLVDPRDETQIAGAIERLLADTMLRERLRRLGLQRATTFSWKKTAQATLRVFEDVV